MGDFGPDWYINTVELVTSLTQVGKYISKWFRVEPLYM